MSKIINHPDINDNEIRIIVSDKTDLVPAGKSAPKPKNRRGFLVVCLIIMSLFALALLAYLFIINKPATEEFEIVTIPAEEVTEVKYLEAPADSSVEEVFYAVAPAPGYVEMKDTAVGNSRLVIFTPENLTPSLSVGGAVLKDTTVKFLLQAADVRKDNGGIVGAFVQEGELLSKGQAKSGFCAIIGGKISIGVADATPLLEQAIETNGYFFRQYPLVVANQVVENKPKNAAFRKALAELDGRIVVIVGKNRQTFHDFSQSLVDLGVTNAIYLVGAYTYGFAVGAKGEITELGGPMPESVPENVSYIVWR